jgi:thiol-disulfide isomerase/thioredoxin
MKSTLNYLSILVCLFPAFVFSQEITDFTLKQTDGSMVSSASYKSKSAWVVVFTGNHCVYSKKYEDRLIALGKEFGAKGVGFLLINSNDPNQNEEESISNMKLRVKDKGYPFVYLQDDQQNVAKMFGAQKNPEVFVLKGSQILFKGAIDNNPLMPEKADKQYLREAIQAALSGKSPSEPSIPANGCNIKWK